MSDAPARPAAQPRIRALDWHRGLAVLVMIECHALIFLSKLRYDDRLLGFFNGINGLVAPSFIFAAGFSLSLVMGRLTGDPAARKKRAIRSLLRIGEVLLVARIMNPPHFYDWHSFFRVDILSCIAYSLLLVWAILVFGGSNRKALAGVMAGMALVVFAITPFTEAMRGTSVLIDIVNNTTGSQFPMIPWAGYVFLGGCLGTLASMPDGATKAMIGFFAMLAFGLALSYSLPLLTKIYRHDYWILMNAGERIWRVALIAIVCLTLEGFGNRRGWAMKNPVTWTLELYGRASLSAFFFHLSLIYGRWGFDPFGRWRLSCGWKGTWGITLLIIVLTGVLCRLLNLLYEVKDRWSARAK